MEIKSYARKGNLGLIGDGERAKAIGNQVSVKSVLGKGTQMMVSIIRETSRLATKQGE
jgi:signal transduction histidine kinase